MFIPWTRTEFTKLNPKESVTTLWDWTDYAELLPVKDKKTRKRLERRMKSSRKVCA